MDEHSDRADTAIETLRRASAICEVLGRVDLSSQLLTIADDPVRQDQLRRMVLSGESR